MAETTKPVEAGSNEENMRLHISYNRFPLRFAALAILLLLPALLAAANSPLSLPQDSDGWTVFTPSSDTRIMYVSSSQGNDSTGQVYNRNDVSDPFNPGNVNAFRTFDAAFNHARSGRPDWVLLRRGDEFSANMTLKNGRGPTEFSLIGAYGSSGDMPLVIPSSGGAVSIPNGLEYVAVVGLDFYARSRDPDSPHFEGTSGRSGFWGTTNRVIQHILIEGSRFRFFSGNGLVTYDSGQMRDVVIRRTLILNNYSGGSGHSQGMFISGADGILLEENVFDHNGWYATASGSPGPATMYNHNTYFEDSHNVTFRGNVFLRPSSMQNKFTANQGTGSSTNITLENNLYVDGEIGIGIGGNNFGRRRFGDVSIRNNVFTEIGRSRPTERNLGWGVELVEWDGGVVRNNYFLHYSNPQTTHIYAMLLEGEKRNVTVESNVVYNLNPHGNSSGGRGILVNSSRATSSSSSSNVVIRDNLVHEPENSIRLFELGDSSYSGPLELYDNQYHSGNEGSAFRINRSTLSFNDWREATSDQSDFVVPSHPDPTRSIETYMQHLGETATIDAFISSARQLSRFNWDTRFTANEVNRWITAGFATASGAPSPDEPEAPTGIHVIE